MQQRRILLFVILTVCLQVSKAQQISTAAYMPSREEEMQRYRDMMILDSTARNSVYKMTVTANWQPDGNSFWYRNLLKDRKTEYVYVDAATGKQQPAFDHEQLAKALSQASGATTEASRLQINNIIFDNKNKQITFRQNGKWWMFDTKDNTVVSTTARDTIPFALSPRSRPRWDRGLRRDTLSPDKQWVSSIRDYNVFIRPVSGGDADRVQFTTDGTKEKPYGQLTWSPDSKYIVGYKIDPREAKKCIIF